MWSDDIKQTTPKDYGEVKRSAEDRVAWRAITCQPCKCSNEEDETR